jgi:hypothetical protein
MMAEKAVLFCGDQRIELPILVGTGGERAVDISSLRDAIGLRIGNLKCNVHKIVPESEPRRNRVSVWFT